jgi:hypothetical protein
VIGGDLFSYVGRKGVLGDAEAKFIAFQLFLALKVGRDRMSRDFDCNADTTLDPSTFMKSWSSHIVVRIVNAFGHTRE